MGRIWEEFGENLGRHACWLGQLALFSLKRPTNTITITINIFVNHLHHHKLCQQWIKRQVGLFQSMIIDSFALNQPSGTWVMVGNIYFRNIKCVQNLEQELKECSKRHKTVQGGLELSLCGQQWPNITQKGQHINNNRPNITWKGLIIQQYLT